MKKLTKIVSEEDRERVINLIVDDDINMIIDDHSVNDDSYVNDIFRIGFKGYDNFTNDQLIIEYNERFVI